MTYKHFSNTTSGWEIGEDVDAPPDKRWRATHERYGEKFFANHSDILPFTTRNMADELKRTGFRPPDKEITTEITGRLMDFALALQEEFKKSDPDGSCFSAGACMFFGLLMSSMSKSRREEYCEHAKRYAAVGRDHMDHMEEGKGDGRHRRKTPFS